MSRGTLGWGVLLVGLGALGAVGWWVFAHESAAPVAPPRPPFVVPCTLSTVERGTLELSVTLTGSVRSLQRARVGFDVAGRLAEIHVREGDRVERGIELARLDPRERDTRHAVVVAARDRAKKELTLLEAGTRTEELERLRAQAAASEADARWTAGEEARLAPLVQGGGVTRSTHESMIAQKNAAAARHEASKAALRLAQAGTRSEELDVQRARVTEAEAEVLRTQAEVDRTHLLAPFAGQVVRRLLAPGDAVQPGAPVLELVDVSALEVDLDVPARHAARLADTAQVTLTVDEFPAFSLTTTLSAVLEESGGRSGSRRALVRLEAGADPAHVLKPGTFVRARATLTALAAVLIVPADSVRRTVAGWVVVKAVPPTEAGPPLPTAAFVPVRLLEQSAGRAAIEPLMDELKAGDRVLVVGADMAFPGAPLLERREAPPAGPAGGPAGGSPGGKDAGAPKGAVR